MQMRPIGLTLCALACLLGSSVSAQSTPRLSQAMFLEQLSDDGMTRGVRPAKELRRGDRVILLVKWQSNSSDTAFTVSSAVPQALAFERSSLHAQSVSVDGGKNWGRIGDLKVQNSSGDRLASVEDVTHLRWQISATKAAQGSGTITYSAIVR